MNTGLLAQLEAYYSQIDEAQEPIQPDEVARYLNKVQALPVQSLPIPGIRRGSLVAAATAVVILLLVGGIAWLSLTNDEPVPPATSIPTETTLPTQITVPPETTDTTVEPTGPATYVSETSIGRINWTRIAEDDSSQPLVPWQSLDGVFMLNGGFVTYDRFGNTTMIEPPAWWESTDGLTWNRGDPPEPFAHTLGFFIRNLGDETLARVTELDGQRTWLRSVGDEWQAVTTSPPETGISVQGATLIERYGDFVTEAGITVGSVFTDIYVSWDEIVSRLGAELSGLMTYVYEWDANSEELTLSWEIAGEFGTAGELIAVLSAKVEGDSIIFRDIETGDVVHTVTGSYPGLSMIQLRDELLTSGRRDDASGGAYYGDDVIFSLQSGYPARLRGRWLLVDTGDGFEVVPAPWVTANRVELVWIGGGFQTMAGVEVEERGGLWTSSEMWRSQDGLTWSQIDKPGFLEDETVLPSLVSDGEHAILSVWPKDYLSADGVSWEPIENVARSPEIGISAQSFGWVAEPDDIQRNSESASEGEIRPRTVNGQILTFSGQIFLSQDGMNWETVTLPDVPRGEGGLLIIGRTFFYGYDTNHQLRAMWVGILEE